MFVWYDYWNQLKRKLIFKIVSCVKHELNSYHDSYEQICIKTRQFSLELDMKAFRQHQSQTYPQILGITLAIETGDYNGNIFTH